MVPILLNLEKIVDGGTSNNFINVIIRSLVVFYGMSKIYLSIKVVCFGADGVTIFQGLKIGVIVQLTNKHCPFLIWIHCMAHWCNLDVENLSSLTLVVKIEALLASIYTYYIQSPKRHLECTKLVEIIESRGLKILRNIQTQWISMLAPSK